MTYEGWYALKPNQPKPITYKYITIVKYVYIYIYVCVCVREYKTGFVK